MDIPIASVRYLCQYLSSVFCLPRGIKISQTAKKHTPSELPDEFLKSGDR